MLTVLSGNKTESARNRKQQDEIYNIWDLLPSITIKDKAFMSQIFIETTEVRHQVSPHLLS